MAEVIMIPADQDVVAVGRALSRMLAVHEVRDVNDLIEMMRRKHIYGILTHGEPDKIIGIKWEMGRMDERWQAVKGDLVYMIACHTGAALAWSLVDVGGARVLAYIDEVMLLSDERFAPEEDPYLYISLRPVAMCLRALATSLSINIARAAHKSETIDMIRLVNGIDDDVMPLLEAFLRHNDEVLDTYSPAVTVPWWVVIVPMVIMLILTQIGKIAKLVEEIVK